MSNINHFNAMFAGPTDAQRAELERSNTVQRAYMAWVYGPGYNATIEQVQAKYREIMQANGFKSN